MDLMALRVHDPITVEVDTTGVTAPSPART